MAKKVSRSCSRKSPRRVIPDGSGLVPAFSLVAADLAVANCLSEFLEAWTTGFNGL